VTNVADLVLDGPDTLGERILAFYGRRPPLYAVYSAGRRVTIHYADDAAEADKQRKAMAQLAPLRGEIDGLIDGWRDGSSHSFFGLENAGRLRSKADRYERRVGDALVLALEGDLPAATATLGAIKQDIIHERTAWARFEYLIAAFAMAMTVMFIAFLITTTYTTVPSEDARNLRWGAGFILLLFAFAAGAAAFLAGRDRFRRAETTVEAEQKFSDGAEAPSRGARSAPLLRLHQRYMPPPPMITGLLLFLLLAIPIFAVFIAPSFNHNADIAPFTTAIDMWRAAAAGTVGAFFSIAIGIRTRTVLPDLLRTSNIMDAVLRITIGFIAGAVLIAMLKLGVVQLQLGTEPLAQAGALSVLLAGFFAGFSERLVPDLLDKAQASPGGSAHPPVHAPAPTTQSTPPAQAGQAGAGPGGAAPPDQGLAAPVTAAAAGNAAAQPDPVPEQASEDGCAADIELRDDEVTRDADLPPATGGVEQPAVGGNP
jgi:hypothetical protein